MTTFTRTWNASYEADPADTDNASEGAARIREVKVDVGERLDVDHAWAGDADDGKHNKVTFDAVQGSDPTLETGEGAIYTKTVSGVSELFYQDSDGTVVQLTAGGVLNNFPSGTKMVFMQAAAPTGWTLDATNDDVVLRINGTAGGGTGGSWTVAGLTNADEAAHTHTFSTTSGGVNTSGPFNLDSGGASQHAHTHTVSGTTDAGSAHTHAISSDGTWRPAYVDGIIATKD